MSLPVFANVYCLLLVYPVLSVSVDCPCQYSLRLFSSSFVPCVASFSGLSISVFSNVYCLRFVYPVLPVSMICPFQYSLTFIAFVLCTRCCQFHWNVSIRILYRLLSSSCVPCVASFPGLSISVFSNVYCLRLVYPVLPFSLECLYQYSLTFIVFVLYTLCCQFLWIVPISII